MLSHGDVGQSTTSTSLSAVLHGGHEGPLGSNQSITPQDVTLSVDCRKNRGNSNKHPAALPGVVSHCAQNNVL